MLQHHKQQNETTLYNPVPDRPVIAEQHIEDYLDHVCAPLIGILSYEDRQRFRETKRDELEATIQAHIELGSTREEAIAATLLARTVPAQTAAKSISESSIKQMENLTVNQTTWRQTQRTAFALSSGNALIQLPLFAKLSNFTYPHHFTWETNIPAMAVTPILMGCVLGYLSPRFAGKAWIKAALLATPLLAVAYFAWAEYLWHFSFVRDFRPIWRISATHATISVLFGLIGTRIGSAVRKGQTTQRSEVKLKNLLSHQ